MTVGDGETAGGDVRQRSDGLLGPLETGAGKALEPVTAEASKPAGPPPLRIGTAERQSAARALNAHLEAGRLDVEEYAERSARAVGATVASEIEELFTDLPAPHPDLPTASGAARAPLAPAAVSSVAEPGPFSGRLPRIAAATPIVATILFFVFNGVFPQAWMFFLLVPLMGALGFSKGHHDREDRKDD
ncbi:DUF1707 domain-containing protein [Pseudonocardia sp.]|jgi:hypothetical protein|uniref:DUF1707 SHOCT-like domain-containing protein n=1 Tax=Pseudonocardia sp. TaxID=60912 RepID=UPI0031FE2EDD